MRWSHDGFHSFGSSYPEFKGLQLSFLLWNESEIFLRAELKIVFIHLFYQTELRLYEFHESWSWHWGEQLSKLRYSSILFFKSHSVVRKNNLSSIREISLKFWVYKIRYIKRDNSVFINGIFSFYDINLNFNYFAFNYSICPSRILDIAIWLVLK